MIDGRRTGDESPDEPAEHARELLVRVLVAILRPAQHEGTHAPRSVGERNDDELPDFRRHPRTKGPLSDSNEPPLMKGMRERIVLGWQHLLEAEVLVRSCRDELERAGGAE